MRIALLPIALLALLATACASAPPASQPGGGATAVCGGLVGAQCPDGTWCDYPDDGAACGAADRQGTCRPRPEICTRIYAPVCGCDGRTYGNACDAQAAGVDVSAQGECPPG